MTILKTVGRHPTLSDVEVLEKMYVNDGTTARQCSREPWLYLGYQQSSATVGYHDLSAATNHRRISESGQTAHAIWRTLPHTGLGEMPS
jgi:hypothetical protein